MHFVMLGWAQIRNGIRGRLSCICPFISASGRDLFLLFTAQEQLLYACTPLLYRAARWAKFLNQLKSGLSNTTINYRLWLQNQRSTGVLNHNNTVAQMGRSKEERK